MDSEAVKKTREHYNSHANVQIDREQVMGCGQGCSGHMFHAVCLMVSEYCIRHWRLAGRALPCP